MSIRNRLMLSIGTILTLFALSCLLSLGSFRTLRAARDDAENTNRVLLQAVTLEEAISRQEDALRGYVLAGASRYAQSIKEAVQRVEQTLHGLQDASAGDPVQVRLLQQIDGLQSEWQRQVQEPIEAQVEVGDLAGARDQLVRGASVTYLDPIRAALKQYRGELERQLHARSATVDRLRWIVRVSILVLLLTGLLIGALSLVVIRRRVIQPLSALKDTTRRLADGERDIRVAFQDRGDEIGAVSRALERFRLIILARDRAAWVRDERGRLIGLLNRSEDDTMLAEQLLHDLVPLFGAGYGALFTPDTLEEHERRFSMRAGHGCERRVDTTFGPGDGLIGSVLESPRIVIVDEVPDGYLMIRSGLGQALPRTLVIAPAMVGDRVVAVLELALFRGLSEAERELLDTLLPHVGLALLSHIRSRRTVHLLGVSQEKTRALETSEAHLREQEENLRQANAELWTQSEEVNAQAAELRASEEELRVQADEMQQANSQLREQQERMQAQAAEMVRLNDQARDRADALARASQYKSEFLTNMSHELRTPLNSLLILSRSLAENDAGNLDGEQVEAAHLIHESGSNLLSLINDILDLSKVEAGKMQIMPEQVTLATLASRVDRQFRHMAKARGLDFDVELEPGLPESIRTDGAKVEQVVRNLVSNALKFTPQGRVRVVFGRPDAGYVFRARGVEASDVLAIRVIDDGIGIPADRLEHIFQAFEQVDGSTSRHYGGTGLGLSISREFARLLGGEISVSSTEGQGSCFTLLIRTDLNDEDGPETGLDLPQPRVTAELKQPRATDEHDTGKAIATMAEPQRTHPLLLIIDDDATFAAEVGRAARRKGFACETAADGESGLARAASLIPDALVLDLGLPDMPGWQVLERLQSDPRTQDIPVHIVSAADDTGRSANAGAIGYVRKPLTREALNSLLARAETFSGRRPQRVLVVDDDHDAHAAILQLLRHETTEVIAATTGAGAMQCLERYAIDCVVLDLSLPDINGFELLERLAARSGAPPVVVYSARDLSMAETARLRAHTDSIVIKGSHSQERLLDEISLFMHHVEDKPGILLTQPPRADEAMAGRTVLLVDDDMRNTFALSRLLRGHGLKVLMASDGFKALDQLEANDEVALVLMDIMMPGMNGYETIQRIRGGTRHAGVPIIALTAKAMASDRDHCIEAGADDYLPKPLDTDRLLDAVRRWIAPEKAGGDD